MKSYEQTHGFCDTQILPLENLVSWSVNCRRKTWEENVYATSSPKLIFEEILNKIFEWIASEEKSRKHSVSLCEFSWYLHIGWNPYWYREQVVLVACVILSRNIFGLFHFDWEPQTIFYNLCMDYFEAQWFCDYVEATVGMKMHGIFIQSLECALEFHELIRTVTNTRCVQIKSFKSSIFQCQKFDEQRKWLTWCFLFLFLSVSSQQKTIVLEHIDYHKQRPTTNTWMWVLFLPFEENLQQFYKIELWNILLEKLTSTSHSPN